MKNDERALTEFVTGIWTVDLGRGMRKLESEDVDMLMEILRSGSGWFEIKKQYEKSNILRWLVEAQYDYVCKQIKYIQMFVQSGTKQPIPDFHKFLMEFFTLRNLFRETSLPDVAVKLRCDWGDLLIRTGYVTRRERRSWGLTKVPPPNIT